MKLVKYKENKKKFVTLLMTKNNKQNTLICNGEVHSFERHNFVL